MELLKWLASEVTKAGGVAAKLISGFDTNPGAGQSVLGGVGSSSKTPASTAVEEEIYLPYNRAKQAAAAGVEATAAQSSSLCAEGSGPAPMEEDSGFAAPAAGAAGVSAAQSGREDQDPDVKEGRDEEALALGEDSVAIHRSVNPSSFSASASALVPANYLKAMLAAGQVKCSD